MINLKDCKYLPLRIRLHHIQIINANIFRKGLNLVSSKSQPVKKKHAKVHILLPFLWVSKIFPKNQSVLLAVATPTSHKRYKHMINSKRSIRTTKYRYFLLQITGNCCNLIPRFNNIGLWQRELWMHWGMIPSRAEMGTKSRVNWGKGWDKIPEENLMISSKAKRHPLVHMQNMCFLSLLLRAWGWEKRRVQKPHTKSEIDPLILFKGCCKWQIYIYIYI